MAKILVFSSMNGGAEAIAPVANELARRGVQCKVLLYGAAEKNVRDFKPEPEILKYASPGCWKAIIQSHGPTAILTGTQVQSKEGPVTPEQLLWEAGKAAGVKTVVVMDTWGNEAERFSDLEQAKGRTAAITGRLTRLPDAIATINEYQRGMMLAQGFPPELLRVTGNPYFEKVASEFAALSPATREEMLKKPVFSSFDPSGKLAVFMSDTMGGYPDIGFTETSVLRSFLAEMDAFARKTGVKINVIVRPHPFRNGDAASAFAVETPDINKVLHNPATAKGSDPANDYSMEQLLFAADLIAGTFNNPLVTAKVVGKPVVHYLPGINPKYEFQKFMSDQGMTTRITQEGLLGDAVEGILAGRIVQKAMESAQGAIERVISLL